MLSVEGQQQIEHILIKDKKLTSQQLESLRLEAAQAGKALLTLVSERKLVDEQELTRLYAQVSATPFVNLENVRVPDDIMHLLPKATAETYMAVPFGRMNGRLAVAMLEPTNVQAIDFITRKTNQPVTAFMASRASIQHVIGQYKSDVSADVSAAIQSAGTAGVVAATAAQTQKNDTRALQTLVQDAPITRALNAILDYAAQSGASDIHIEPREKDLAIRYRIDGILEQSMTLPKSVEPALISRIKILSNLKIDEHRVPQDGQFQIRSGNKDVDLRIAIAPVVFGEQVVIRLLDKSSTLLTLESLGFRGRAMRLITEGIHRPHGMTLSTGPTGSGKSTTLYAVISAIKDVSINIVTLEDPVEYKMEGINQMQVNNEVGLTFASGLRSILRQDPNVVMVGEIRDKETADLAVQAALTGHLVLSTLHTNSAAGVLPRLLDMAIEPFLIASTINTVIGQRLVRRLCEKCREPYKSSQLETDTINTTLKSVLPKTKQEMAAKAEDLGYDDLPLAAQTAYTLYRPKGCNACNGGYKGRVGVYEVFAMNPAVEKMLLRSATTSEIQAQAQTDGMLTMKQDGYLKMLTGMTSLSEVARVAADS